MTKELYSNFGKLTLKQKKINDISDILSNEDRELDILFQDHLHKLEKLTVIDSERRIALENLRKLTIQLQTKRLRKNSKASCKYFTL